MTLQEKVIAEFQNQEAGFKSWLKAYYETAMDLELLNREMGDEAFFDWLTKNFTPDQFCVATNMQTKLRNTDTGKAILKAYKQTGNFNFPA